ncbi:peptide chain release factor 2 [Fusobacterium sp. MFO224]|uniref:peptide chain release factor 2 n=1 Tax=Fusobacterium sp. MFO224 TaxID=3378070 RepID=UPI003853D078
MDVLEINREFQKFKDSIANIKETLKLENRILENKKLENETLKENFWSDKQNSQKVINRINENKELINEYNQIQEIYDEEEIIFEFITSGEEEFKKELLKKHETLKEMIEKMDIKLLLDGKYDNNNAIVTIHSGAGGTEACDWVEMLYRMYTRWTNTKKYKISQMDFMPGDSVGIKSITFLVEGPMAYGYLKGEKGIHRLVRISPFDANKKRHTSFASVDVLPEVNNDIEIKIKPEDIRVDTYRAGGAGGQHVNMTDSAVRITHFSTGIVTTCQQERSQLLNKEKAMKVLKSKLLDLEIQKQEAEMKKIQGEQSDIGWGNQIRSYVFQPYMLVKDHRTNHEMGNVRLVMDGGIDDFINSYLRWMKSK